MGKSQSNTIDAIGRYASANGRLAPLVDE